MTVIVPEVLDLLNNWEIVPAPVPAEPNASDFCPKCGDALYMEYLHVGGRGYQPYEYCASGECSFMRRVRK